MTNTKNDYESGKRSFTYNIHQKLLFLDPLPFFVTKSHLEVIIMQNFSRKVPFDIFDANNQSASRRQLHLNQFVIIYQQDLSYMHFKNSLKLTNQSQKIKNMKTNQAKKNCLATDIPFRILNTKQNQQVNNKKITNLSLPLTFFVPHSFIFPIKCFTSNCVQQKLSFVSNKVNFIM